MRYYYVTSSRVKLQHWLELAKIDRVRKPHAQRHMVGQSSDLRVQDKAYSNVHVFGNRQMKQNKWYINIFAPSVA